MIEAIDLNDLWGVCVFVYFISALVNAGTFLSYDVVPTGSEVKFNFFMSVLTPVLNSAISLCIIYVLIEDIIDRGR